MSTSRTIDQIRMKSTSTALFAFLLLAFVAKVQAQSQRSIQEPLPTRQVHLDFHTSEHIPGIGERFDKEQFQKALQAGRVNQINIFGKGHHGWSYYPTKLGHVHPHLSFDLLGEQIEACHEIGVKAPIYFTVGWSANDAENHPEWCIRKKDGSIFTMNLDMLAAPTAPRPNYSWQCLCPAISGPYHQAIMEQVEEICSAYDVDGFWFDIYHIANECYCQYCLQRMKAEGVDLTDTTAVSESMNLAFKAHMKALREMIAKYHPEATVYFNATTRLKDRQIFKQRLYDMNTHQDLEDLPSTWGGYDNLPLESKYHLGQGVASTAMSGKFHKAWGEFGGFKHPEAIKYEAAAMISFGVSCNFGDQLHPSGEMDMETYRRIGEAYQYVEKIEDYGPGGRPVAKLGMWLTLDQAADHGTSGMLLELHHDYIIANEENLDELELLIMPGHASLSEEQAEAINDWVAKGGKLIVFGAGALDKNSSRFVLDVGAEYVQAPAYDFDFTVATDRIGKEVVSTPFLNYEAGMLVRPTSGEVLATIREPYFNRTYEQYSSHRETPFKLEDSEFPAVVKHGNVIFFAHALDRLYHQHGVRLHRQLFANAIDLLYKSPMLRIHNLPSSGRVSLLKQEEQSRYVAHLLYSPAIKRGEVMVMEDFLPVPGVALEVEVPEKIKRVYQVPGNNSLKYVRNGNLVKIVLPQFTMHAGVVMEY
jgi:hypothetical protein